MVADTVAETVKTEIPVVKRAGVFDRERTGGKTSTRRWPAGSLVEKERSEIG